MGLTISEMATSKYGEYSVKNSKGYNTYGIDQEKISEKYFGISNVSDAIEAMENAIDSSSLYRFSKIDSFVKNQYQFSQIGIYENLRKTVASYDVAGVTTNNTDLSKMYELANTSNQISEEYFNNLLKTNGYTLSDTASYSAYLEEDSPAEGLLDITV